MKSKVIAPTGALVQLSMITNCKSIDCKNTVPTGQQFCIVCLSRLSNLSAVASKPPATKLSDLYPAYYKDVAEIDEIDVYQICELFKVTDCSGALQHAIKKLLLSGQRNGGKPQEKDITEARDTLTRYLSLKRVN